MRLRTLAAAALAALLLAPAAFAEDSGAAGAKDMKGPPNAAGYGKEQMGDTVVKDEKASSAKDMKGPPNANGYEKK